MTKQQQLREMQERLTIVRLSIRERKQEEFFVQQVIDQLRAEIELEREIGGANENGTVSLV